MDNLSMQAQANKSFLLKLSRVSTQTLIKCALSLLEKCAPPLLQNSQVKNESQKYTIPSFSLLWPSPKRSMA
jgi:hypothetical protein